MRFVTLAILGLALAAGPALANGQRGKTPAQTTAAKPAGQRVATVAPRPAAQVHRSAPLRGQVGVSRDARAASASTAGAAQRRGTKVARSTPMRWMQGLPAPANIQANECPDGTMATLARGHDDIVRCMPI